MSSNNRFLPSQSQPVNNCLVLLLRIFCLFPSNFVSQYCSPILSTVSGWKSTWKPWKASLSCRKNSCQPATKTSAATVIFFWPIISSYLELADLSIQRKRVEKHWTNEGDVSGLAVSKRIHLHTHTASPHLTYGGFWPLFMTSSCITYNRFPSCC